jgi:hypothetical protein
VEELGFFVNLCRNLYWDDVAGRVKSTRAILVGDLAMPVAVAQRVT